MCLPVVVGHLAEHWVHVVFAGIDAPGSLEEPEEVPLARPYLDRPGCVNIWQPFSFDMSVPCDLPVSRSLHVELPSYLGSVPIDHVDHREVMSYLFGADHRSARLPSSATKCSGWI